MTLPAEWHPQSGIQLTWPHAGTDWNYMLKEVESCYLNIAREIAQREILLIVTPFPDEVESQIKDVVNMENVRFFKCDTNDTWARDHGPISLIDDNGMNHIYDFKFNGWGLKFASNFDNLITSKADSSNLFNAVYHNKLNFVLEGGGIESDGKGNLLTTSECLLSKNRNGQYSKQEIESYLKNAFNVTNVLWVDHGYLSGDDTDSHIDTLARLCPDDTIAYVQCDDPIDEHFEALHEMEKQLKSFKTAEGLPFRLVALPMADAAYEEDERLPATYANFLIMNEVVLLPTYNSPEKDKQAKDALQECFPNHEIVCIDCSALIRQHGSLHCVTMQYPEGILK